MLLCLNNFRYVKVDNVKETEVGNSLVTVKGVMKDELFFADDYVVIVSDEAIGEPVEIVTADMLMDGWVVFDNFLTGYVCGGFGEVFVLNVERPLIEGDEGAVILPGWRLQGEACSLEAAHHGAQSLNSSSALKAPFRRFRGVERVTGRERA